MWLWHWNGERERVCVCVLFESVLVYFRSQIRQNDPIDLTQVFCWENKSSTYSQRNCTQKDYWTKCALFNEQTDTELNDTNNTEKVLKWRKKF